MLSLQGKRVVVVGLGASGVAAARLCARRGARVVATDRKAREALGEDARALERDGVTLAVGGPDRARLEGAELVVVSPGVPTFAELEEAERRGVRRSGARSSSRPSCSRTRRRSSRSGGRTARARPRRSRARSSTRTASRRSWGGTSASRCRTTPTSASTRSSSRCRASRWSGSRRSPPRCRSCSM